MQQEERWLNPLKFYEKYEVTESTQAKWRMKKIIPYIKVGRFIWYDQQDLDKWFVEHKIVGVKL